MDYLNLSINETNKTKKGNSNLPQLSILFLAVRRCMTTYLLLKYLKDISIKCVSRYSFLYLVCIKFTYWPCILVSKNINLNLSLILQALGPQRDICTNLLSILTSLLPYTCISEDQHPLHWFDELRTSNFLSKQSYRTTEKK